MAGAPINFPTSTAPGVNATENGGRLINAFAEPLSAGARNTMRWIRAAGLRLTTLVGSEDFRGALLVGSLLYVINGDKAYTVSKSGTTYTVTELTGTVAGSGAVIMARNMRATVQILIVHSDGMSKIEAGAAADFSDGDLPAANSVTFMDGYFFVTSLAGKVYASAINDVTFNSLDNATAESSPDGLVRAVGFGRDLLLLGEGTTEFWGNTGNATGFPFSRGPVIPVGLKTALAIAGFEAGFPDPLMWVGNDNTVRRLNGYVPERVSTPTLERLIELAGTDLEASVYNTAGRSWWVLSGPTWTWAFDMVLGQWHERQSYGQDRWRAHYGAGAFGEWLTFDRDSAKMFAVDGSYRREDSDPLIWEVRSTQDHRFPGGLEVHQAAFNFVTGVGSDTGISPIETDPRVSISWSNDGGRTFGNELLRDMGRQGQQRSISISRCGLSGENGRQWRLRCSDPVEVSLIGGAMDFSPLKTVGARS
jgi:hypothetical protein